MKRIQVMPGTYNENVSLEAGGIRVEGVGIPVDDGKDYDYVVDAAWRGPEGPRMYGSIQAAVGAAAEDDD